MDTLELELGAVCIIASSSFMLLGCFFVRAYKSVITWNLNMFTLIGIGSGLLSIQPVWLIFPRILSKRIQN
jgi:Cu2+-exporting ATPase